MEIYGLNIPSKSILCNYKTCFRIQFLVFACQPCFLTRQTQIKNRNLYNWVLSRYDHVQLKIKLPRTEYRILALQDNYILLMMLFRRGGMNLLLRQIKFFSTHILPKKCQIYSLHRLTSKEPYKTRITGIIGKSNNVSRVQFINNSPINIFN